jgi:hypothetical protein
MKQIKTMMAALFVIAAASSCKKTNDVTPPPATSGFKLSKIENPANGYLQTFNYNSSGRLVKVTDNSFIVNYSYVAAPFSYEVKNTSNVIENDLANIVFLSNKMTSFDYRFYNASGVPSGSETVTVQYDANGYQTQKAYPGYVYTSVISGGNTTSLTKTNTTNGTTRTYTYEYYTDKPNNLNINYFEYLNMDHILSDMEITGKKNTNLIKKLTYTSGANTEVTAFTYEINANGMPGQYTATRTTGAGAVSTYTLKFSYQ